MTAQTDQPVGEAAPGFVARARSAVATIIASRLFLALAGVLVIAFAAHAVFAPTRGPAFAGAALVELGLAPPVPAPSLLPEVQAELDKAKAAAQPYLQDIVARTAQDANAMRMLNLAGAGLSGLLLVLGLYLQTRRTGRG